MKKKKKFINISNHRYERKEISEDVVENPLSEFFFFRFFSCVENVCLKHYWSSVNLFRQWRNENFFLIFSMNGEKKETKRWRRTREKKEKKNQKLFLLFLIIKWEMLSFFIHRLQLWTYVDVYVSVHFQFCNHIFLLLRKLVSYDV